jgi:hypothetical protein
MSNVFIHIPKTGGSSIRKKLPLDVNVIGHNLRHPSFQLYRKNKEDFVFAFVRDPLDRFISAFNYLQQGGRNEHDNMDAYYSGAKALSIEEFAEKRLQGVAAWQIHLLPQTFWLQHAQADYIGRFENLSEDFQRVCWVKGIDAGYLDIQNRSKKQDEIDVKRMQRYVHKVYEEDYEFIEKYVKS